MKEKNITPKFLSEDKIVGYDLIYRKLETTVNKRLVIELQNL